MAGLKSILREEKKRLEDLMEKKYLPDEKFTGGNLEGIG